MKKPNEVLFRLHAVKAPDVLNIVTAVRNDDFLKKQHDELGILPGTKVFQTVIPVDGPWRLSGVIDDLKQGGYTLLDMNIELRPGTVKGSFKPVMSLNFGQGTSTCTPEQIAWVEEYLGRAVFKLAQAYHNPRVNGTSQLAIDCAQASKLEPGLLHLPLRRLLGLNALTDQTTPV